MAWNLDVRASVVATYGSSALFLTTDVRYVPPLPQDSDHVVTYPTGDGDPAPVGMSAELKADLKKDAFTSRQREIRKQKEDEKKIYSVLWMRMSPVSQSKVREQAEFEVADVSKDCVVLWTMIKRTHLTNINGAQAPMVRLNKRDQMVRYNALRQGDREYVASFKIRYNV